jgi:hypothetical protein
VHFAFQQPILSCLATGMMHFTIVLGPRYYGNFLFFFSL